MVPGGKFQQRSELAPKKINYEASAKAKRNPREGISRDFYSQGRSNLAPKGSNSEVPAGQFLCSVQFLRRSELAPKWINSEVSSWDFCANGVWNSNMDFKFWARGRVYQDLKKLISPLHGSLFSWVEEVEIRRTFARILKPSVPPLHQLSVFPRDQLIASLISLLLPL